jgi:hypothetical protein
MRYFQYIDADGKLITEKCSGGIAGANEVGQEVYDAEHPPVPLPPPGPQLDQLIDLLKLKGLITPDELTN